MYLLLHRRQLGVESTKAVEEASQYLTAISNYDPWPEAPLPHDLVFRWGCTSTIPCRNVVNKARAIHIVNDKAGFRALCMLASYGLTPVTWFSWNDTDITYPCIIRPHTHFQGRDLYFCQDENDACDALEFIGDNYYISEYIHKVAEYRVFVVQGRIAFMYKKVPADPSAIAWNHSEGSTSVNVKWSEWPRDVCEKAAKAFHFSGLDFGAIDVIVDENDRAYVLEINTAPAIESPYRASCIAKCFDYIIENGKDYIGSEFDKGWRGFIHPAISEEAI